MVEARGLDTVVVDQFSSIDFVRLSRHRNVVSNVRFLRHGERQ